MAQHKQFIITPETCVDDMLNGVQATYPGLSVDIKSRVIFHAQEPPNNNGRVGLLSGGGSGHEPFAAGYVGEGMLTAAVAGSVFSAPPASHILTAVCNVAAVSPGGVLVILNNYTGDILNFGLAVERAKAKGYNANSIIIDEDCAIDKPEGAGKRGLCGCLFVLKIAGGMSLMGKTLEDISSECTEVKKHIVTLGVTVKACNMPGLGLMFQIEDGLMEVGVGIHGEAGASKHQMLSADKIVELILEKLCKTLIVKKGDKVCTIVNNLGGSSQLELFLVAGLVCAHLKTRGVQVVRQYVGTLMTSLDMAGIQVSLLLLPASDKLWLDCLDAPTNAFAWPGNSLTLQTTCRREIVKNLEADTQMEGPTITSEEAVKLKQCLKTVAEALKSNEHTLNELDKGCGDGDTGSTLKRMADAILQDVDEIPARAPQLCFLRLSKLAEEVMGGTSGALYSLMFVGAARHVPQWSAAWQGALDMAMTYSNARLGSRTMFDALIPACQVFKDITTRGGNWREALSKAVDAADEGCSKTQFYKPLFGRATYVDASNIRSMDAGAYGVTVWLKALKTELL
ncbi:triokinase/FMN cyclase-like isoform X2 [Homalodisca vitripennis]|nr:triokinase/FMN cyclase-like isoform X2 [Homalodisca vitripennis]XP_046669439.1 triokinase/FMN cyclase-like isoform X2 [Homalodisca vitripennis]XP_046669440.1 triokinase/FMN cyclase-like isoform X2 [Homalodisca vitripennis]KAG8271310.1 hypothetical protein J6590_065720 [Homalodisca vitripennis]